MKKVAIFFIAICSFSQIPLPGSGGGGGGGINVVVAAPYITVGATKYVAATMWPFTAFFSGSFLDANTCTLTAGTNGSELESCALSTANAWYVKAATTSVEAELQALVATTGLTNSEAAGIAICDTTNNKIYALFIVAATGSLQYFYELVSYTETACAGTPTAASVLGQFPVVTNGISHMKMSVSGGNLITQISNDGGQTYIQLDSRAVGTIAKAGTVIATTGNITATATFLSIAIN